MQLTKLPIHLFNKEALFFLASIFGQPLRLDAATAAIRRPSVARVQVELDLLKDRPDMVWIGVGNDDGFWQKVKYETLPACCTYCWHVGHDQTTCHVKHPELKVLDKSFKNSEDGKK